MEMYFDFIQAWCSVLSGCETNFFGECGGNDFQLGCHRAIPGDKGQQPVT